MKSKKLIGVVAGLLFATAVFAARTRYVNGTYTGAADGRNGPIELTLTVKGRKITDVTITKEDETAFAKPAEQYIIDQVIKNQSVEGIEAMSGATITSNATLEAIGEAIAKASGN